MRVRRLRNNWLSSLRTMAKMRSLILVTYASFCLILRSARQNTMAEKTTRHENCRKLRKCRIRQADHKKSEHLAHYDFRGAHGGGKQLLHGAHLPLAGYRERSQQRGNDHHHGGDQARHDVVRGFQGAVVPDAHARIHGGNQRYTGAAVLPIGAHLQGIVLYQALHVAQGDGCGVGIAAIQQNLNVGLTSGIQALGVIAWDHDAQKDRALVDVLFNIGIAIRESLDLKKSGAAEALDEGAAVGAVVAVEDQRRNEVHVQLERVAEQQHLKQRQEQRHDEAAGVAQDMAELLLEHGMSASEAHGFFCSSASISPTKTSSMVGWIGSSRLI